MTIRDFAKKTGISPATLSRFASGKSIDVDTLIKLTRVVDPELSEEIELLQDYWRMRLHRRAKDGGREP